MLRVTHTNGSGLHYAAREHWGYTMKREDLDKAIIAADLSEQIAALEAELEEI